MGLLKEKSQMSTEKQLEISRRAAEAGKQIQLRNVERNLEREAKLKEERDQLKNEEELNILISQGYSAEDAMSQISKKNDENNGALDS